MQTKQVTDTFSISDQLSPADVDQLAAAGIKTLVCNRPDGEVANQPTFADITARAQALGIETRYLPVVHDFINSSDAGAFADILANADGPVHAWCRSGLRSMTLWALAQLKNGADPASVLAQAAALGFDFSGLTRRFAPVLAELTNVVAGYPLARHCPLLIVGGGAAGIALAASLLRRDRTLQITIVEPSEQHYYQPGLTLVGAGVFNVPQLCRKTADLIPAGVTWLRSAVTNFLPEQNQVVLDDNTRVSYGTLAVCAGLKLDWAAIEGLPQTLGKNGVTSNYSPELAPYTWDLVQQLGKGKALFTQPPMPIKCAGAPQKVMYLSSDHWLRNQRLKDIEVHFHNAGAVLFGVKDYVPALESYVQRYGIHTHFGHNLVRVDGDRKIATFVSTGPDGNPVRSELAFDMLHVTPPQRAPDFVRNSPLADRAGWIDVDPASLRHRKYQNVWGLGDVTNTPNAKTAAAVRKQVPVAASNIVADLRQQPQVARYDGYGSCPLTVERGKIVLAEFGYGGKLQPTFPAWLNAGTKPTRAAWFLKKSLLPWIYWHLMLKGHETLTAPHDA